MKKYNLFLFLSGLLLLTSEIWKQYTLTCVLGGGTYDWWYFPFQLCSIPMYVCLLLPWTGSFSLRCALAAFLVDYGMLGGIFAFFDTTGMQYASPLLTLHSYLWHILLVLIGLVSAQSFPAAAAWKNYRRASALYLLCCLTAEIFNFFLGRLGRINMFYINPAYPMEQRFFSEIADLTGNLPSIILYLAACMTGAAVFHRLWSLLCGPVSPPES